MAAAFRAPDRGAVRSASPHRQAPRQRRSGNAFEDAVETEPYQRAAARLDAAPERETGLQHVVARRREHEAECDRAPVANGGGALAAIDVLHNVGPHGFVVSIRFHGWQRATVRWLRAPAGGNTRSRVRQRSRGPNGTTLPAHRRGSGEVVQLRDGGNANCASAEAMSPSRLSLPSLSAHPFTGSFYREILPAWSPRETCPLRS